MRYGLAALGGGLYSLGYLGWGAWPCLFVFLVPLWWALDDEPGTPGRAFRAGLVFGAAAFCGGHLWLLPLIGSFLDGQTVSGSALWVAYGIWFAIPFALYAACVDQLRRRATPFAVAVLPPFVLTEWVQPQVFPLYAGNGLVPVPLLVQSADIGGPLLLTALLVAVNAVCFETLRWTSGRRAMPLAVWGAALVGAAGVTAYGATRLRVVDARNAAAPAIRVGVVQPNLDVRDKDALGVIAHRRHLEQTRALLEAGPIDLVVWPESAYVRGIRRPLPVASQPIVRDLAVPLLFGASSTTELDGRKVRINSALLAGADGMIRTAYDKNLLIPFAETLPTPGLATVFPHAEEFAAAREVSGLELGPWRIATPICYEAIRPDFVRRMVTTIQPHLLVTLANDALFGDSQEPWLHLGLAQLRAIEHRRWLVRATNTGVSAIVDPAGRLVEHTGVGTRESLRATVRLLDGATVYSRVGDWPGWVSLGFLATALVRARRS